MKNVLQIRFIGRVDYDPNDPDTLVAALAKFGKMKKLAEELQIEGDWNNKTQRVQSKKRAAKSDETEGETENSSDEKNENEEPARALEETDPTVV